MTDPDRIARSERQNDLPESGGDSPGLGTRINACFAELDVDDFEISERNDEARVADLSP